jgi:alkylhydroperoxidase family enzyme
VLDDYQSAPIADGLRATLGFLDTMTRRPEALTAQDARAVLAAGVSREALAEAVHVAYLFNIYDRLADTLGWDVPPADDGSYVAGARNLLQRGYL